MTPRDATGRRPEASTHRPLGRLAQYAIEGLFGRREITFELGDAGPTILTGANGSGKSTVLRTIDAVSTRAWQLLAQIPFSRLTLSFSSDIQLIVTPSDRGLTITRTDQDAPWSWSPPDFFLRPSEALLSDAAAALVDPNLRTSLSLLYPSFQYPLYWGSVGTSTAFSASTGEPPQGSGHWLNRLPSDFPVLFITADRLVVSARTHKGAEAAGGSEVLRTSTAVEQAIQNIGEVQAQALAEYARSSQSIDRDFLPRVIAAMEQGNEPSERELDKVLTDVAVRRDKLLSVGLLPGDEPPLETLRLTADNAKTVVRVFAEDTLRKFEALEPVRARLSVLVDFLNRHYRGKQLFIDSTEGAIIVDTEAAERRVLQPTSLSSGEQQILVLAHQVLFRASGGTLVLIDEPELSLHVLWQSDFIDDLGRMGEVSNLSFLLATHSPTLVADREDLRRSLDRS